MKKKLWLAHPWLSGLLGLTWLLLQRSVEPFHLFSALLISLIVPRLLHGFLPQGGHINIKPVLGLTGVVLWDIAASNIKVARLVLGPRTRMQPGWVVVPLTLRNPTAISLFATIITTTPGTVSCLVDEHKWVILVHALHCIDAPRMAADMKARYEQPLLAIFESTPPLTGGTA